MEKYSHKNMETWLRKPREIDQRDLKTHGHRDLEKMDVHMIRRLTSCHHLHSLPFTSH
jgi:hypothetical protein